MPQAPRQLAATPISLYDGLDPADTALAVSFIPASDPLFTMSQLDNLSNAAASAAANGDHQQALDHFNQILQLSPRDSQALYGCCVALKALNQREPLLAYTNRLFKAGTAYHEAAQPQQALFCFEKVLALGFEAPPIYLNCGLLLRKLGRREEALAYFEQACGAAPGDLNAALVRALLLQEMNRHREALAAYQRALELDPNNYHAHFNAYASHLVLGEFEPGWKKFGWRWRHTPDRRLLGGFSEKLWNGEPALDGKTIMLYAEHGQGDAIQFCRFAQQVAQRGATVILMVQPSLKTILTGVAGVHQVLAQDEPIPPFDYHCPLMNLPEALGITLDTIPADLPYLQADPLRVSAWAGRLGPRDGRLRVGLVWAGEARPDPDELAMNRRRSILFEQFAPLLDLPGIAFYSVQKGIEAQRQLQQNPRRERVLDFSDGFTDFAETAAMLEQLDLLLTVDTGVAHLAAALGRPVWLLNRFDTCWRWLLERDDTPWYPGVMRIFRQPSAGDWDSVMSEVGLALAALAVTHGQLAQSN